MICQIAEQRESRGCARSEGGERPSGLPSLPTVIFRSLERWVCSRRSAVEPRTRESGVVPVRVQRAQGRHTPVIRRRLAVAVSPTIDTSHRSPPAGRVLPQPRAAARRLRGANHIRQIASPARCSSRARRVCDTRASRRARRSRIGRPERVDGPFIMPPQSIYGLAPLPVTFCSPRQRCPFVRPPTPVPPPLASLAAAYPSPARRHEVLHACAVPLRVHRRDRPGGQPRDERGASCARPPAALADAPLQAQRAGW